MATIQPHNFAVGDKVIVTDHHTSFAMPIGIPCYIQSIDDDTYIVRKRDFKSPPFRVGRYYPHIKADNL